MIKKVDRKFDKAEANIESMKDKITRTAVATADLRADFDDLRTE